MSESVPVRCPACRRAHCYTAPAYPCECGAPVAPPLDRHATPTRVAHRVWQEEWVTLRCGSCGRRGEWPRPELGCPCGTVLRIPVAAFRSTRDAVMATVLYLRSLGYRGIRRADQYPPSGIGLAAGGLIAQVDPGTHPATLRDVECLWLTAMTTSAACAYFSLSGYADDARARADALGIPLFGLGLTGVPRPVNSPAHGLHATGPESL